MCHWRYQHCRVMQSLDSMCNVTLFTEYSFNITARTYIFIGEYQKYTITLINYVFLCSSISLFGQVANAINMIIFHRQGLTTTINISFFALAVSDFCNLLFQQLSNVYVNPLFVQLDLPMVYSEVQFLTVRLARVLFSRVTFFITVYITAERCLCVVLPLHIKQIITPKKTVTILVAIYGAVTVSVLPVFCVTYLGWKFHPGRNKTLLGIVFRKYKSIVIAAAYFYQAISGMLAFLAVVVLTLVLIHKLLQKGNWRKAANLPCDKSVTMSQRNRTTVKMVVLIASVLIICYIPSVCLCLTTFIEPEFTEGGKHYSFYASFWSIAMLLETINSSVNIIFYYKMSSKYRQTFRDLFSCCFHKSNSHGILATNEIIMKSSFNINQMCVFHTQRSNQSMRRNKGER